MSKYGKSKVLGPLYWLLGAVVAILGLKTVLNIVRGGKNLASALKNDVKSQVINNALNQYGISDVRVSVVQSIVNEIYAAFHKDAWLGWGEDEGKAVDEFNKLQNINEAKAASIMYKEVFNKSLYDEYQKYLYSFERSKLKSYLYEAIKGM